MFCEAASLGVIAGCASAPPPSAGSLTPGDHSFDLRHDGRDRSYIAHTPPQVSQAAPLPVLIAYHGGGGNARGFQEYAGLDRVADRQGFVVVYPDGVGPLNLHTWNAGACCGRAQIEDVDDVDFTMSMLDDLASAVPIDRRRVYATGHSNGAMMAYRLAAEQAGQIAAIAPVAGAMTLGAAFQPVRPVPVLHIHSVDDPRALYEGGVGPPFPFTGQRVTHQPVDAALNAWIQRDGCPADPVVESTVRGAAGTSSEGHRATKLVWSPCADDVVVEHWRLEGPGHAWPGGAMPGGLLRERLVGPPTTVIDAAEEVWAFVSRFVLP